MKKLMLLFFLCFTSIIAAQIPTELQAYYSGIDFSLNGTTFENDLTVLTISKHSTFLAYSERHDYLYDADEDTSNTVNVILIYNGESRDEREYQSGNNAHSPQTFNTEHVYPRSLLLGTSEADLHHLRVCDISINSSRGNQAFAPGSGSYGNVSGGWYPGDEWKGDVARMIMYLNLRYNEAFTDVGSLSLFLGWNAEDPVSTIEIQRNNIIEGAQGNRNPFIDNPFMATKIWGGTAAEDRWGTLVSEDFALEKFSIYPIPSKTNKIFIQSGTEIIKNINLFNLTGQLVYSQKNKNSNSKIIELNNLSSGLYVLKVHSEQGVVSKKVIIN